MRRALAAVLALALAGCYPRASVPDTEREKSRELEGQRRFAKVALYAGPFYGDAGRMLVSDQPFDELDLLQDTAGDAIAPPPAERVLAPGTPLRIEKVEFPTGWIIARRVVMTPRYHPWVFLSLEGEPRPLVLVLPQTLASAEDVRVELERYLGGPEALTAFQALPDPQRAAVERKRLVEGMSARAVEMAWGYPEKKVIDRPAHTEAWSWSGGDRKAYLQDDKLERWEPLR
ncbi:hypothetical protein [Anaeromyxobacter diazotrophicus]|nr:hypothetical protein [Anaeromyxobacter diazotrophicus]